MRGDGQLEYTPSQTARKGEMLSGSRVSGVASILSAVKHGSHMCAFYETKDDLIDLVTPFFTNGLNNGDACVWVMPDGVEAEEPALQARAAIAEGGVELHSGRALYLGDSCFDRERVKTFWNQKAQQALGVGRSGLYASGDAFWLDRKNWDAFLDYEAELSRTIADQPISLLCTYPLSMSYAGDIFDVACAHHVAIAKRKKRWEVIKGWGVAEAPQQPQRRRLEALDAADRIVSLSPRERQVLDGLTDGRSSKVIAYHLGISARTVEVHRAHLLDRLKVRTTAEAVRLLALGSLITQP